MYQIVKKQGKGLHEMCIKLPTYCSKNTPTCTQIYTQTLHILPTHISPTQQILIIKIFHKQTHTHKR